jgi:hypothetical protein
MVSVLMPHSVDAWYKAVTCGLMGVFMNHHMMPLATRLINENIGRA